MASEAEDRRKARLSVALRENLKRRKAQIRARNAAVTAGGQTSPLDAQPPTPSGLEPAAALNEPGSGNHDAAETSDEAAAQRGTDLPG